MAKKLSGWFRMFIVFAVVWTIFAAYLLYDVLPYKKIAERELGSDKVDMVFDLYPLSPQERHKVLMDRYPGYAELSQEEQEKVISDIFLHKKQAVDLFVTNTYIERK